MSHLETQEKTRAVRPPQVKLGASEIKAGSATMATQFAQVLEAHRGQRHLIVLHDYPDPDAISAAFAHKLLCAQYEIECDIVYSGRISHRQNIAMVRLLGIELTRFGQVFDVTKYHGAAFVDNQGTVAEAVVEALEAANVPAVTVVDHHEVQERLSPAFSDIRQAGSTATIYTEYLQHLLGMNRSQRDHVRVATALTHGILTDTGNFIRAGVEDFHAAAFLSHYTDADLLSQIMNQSRSKQVMDIIHKALGNRVTAESFSIAGIGYLRAEDRDAIPQAADFLLTEENIHTVIVYGIVTDAERGEALVGSMRTSKITIDPDDFLKDTFGKDVTGNYFGGGKMSAGAFEIPIGFLSGRNQNSEFLDLKWQVYDKQIKQKIFGKIGIEANVDTRQTKPVTAQRRTDE
jgi:nanoRNase/pAp phosphatase (c-di-AMP/oligoRNAs hydrolase)